MVAEGYRLSYRECRDLLSQRVAEPAPGRIQLLSGPRQVGKTTLLLELASRLAGSSASRSPTGQPRRLRGLRHPGAGGGPCPRAPGLLSGRVRPSARPDA